MSLWSLVGRVTFWIGWPLLWLYLPRTKRTRVVVACGDEVLVVRGWLSGGWWSLPGGGLHRGEHPLEGAVRELQEETGIGVNATELQSLFAGTIKTERGMHCFVHAYGLALDEKPSLTKQRLELIDLAWVQKEELLASPKTAADVHDLVQAFYDKIKPD